MTTLKVAHIREQGVDLIIFPLERSFGNQSDADQEDAMAELQMRADEAGLAGNVAAVWDAGGGRMGFRAPQNQHAFFRSIDLRFVWANVNRKLSW